MLITPVKILIVMALLALYGVYAGWMAIVERSLVYGFSAAIAIVACVGAALLKPWSRYLVYLLATAVVGSWAYSVYDAARVGYFGLFSRSEVFIALVPEVFLMLLSCYCVYAVFTQFRVRRSSGSEQRVDDAK
jgi:hypothetical protein